ncbi:hypothetical protein BH10PSE15_BH10PSE15_12660 [soil metagenome]
MKIGLMLAATIISLSGAARAEEGWRAARIAGDTAFLERFHARQGRIQGMDGKVQSRDADIATYRETAIVSGVDHLDGTAFGHYGEMFLRFTDVLVKRDGRWQLVVQQTAPTSGF